MLLNSDRIQKSGCSGKSRTLIIAIIFFFLGYIISSGMYLAVDKLDRFISALSGSKIKNTPVDITAFLDDPQLISAAILGGGGAGFTAALYLARAGYVPHVFTGRSQGGAIAKTQTVHNWPGAKLIDGPILAQNWKDQAVSNGAVLENLEVVSIDLLQWPFMIQAKELTNGKIQNFKALSCIITTGATPNYLGVKGESKLWGKGITNCAICDSALVKNGTAIVVGGGDSAVVEARTLAHQAKQVFVLVRGKKLKAKDISSASFDSMPNIKILFETSVKEILGDLNGVTGVIVQTGDAPSFEIKTSGVFLAIGSRPNTVIFNNQLQTQANGCLKLFNGQHTSISGVFAAGDVTDCVYRQAIIAAGDGCKAALQTIEFLEAANINPELFTNNPVAPTNQNIKKKQNTTKSEAPENYVNSLLAEEAASDSSASTDKQNKLDNTNLLKQEEQKEEEKEEQEESLLEIKTEEEFSNIIMQASATNKIVMLDFFGTWCQPCKILHDVLQKIAKEYQAKTFVCTVDVDVTPELASTYKIRGVPTIVFFDGKGRELSRMTGFKDSDEITAMIKNCIT